ncbi:MAG: peroxiredoxin [Oscillatoriaceae cyanobacterium Prado104]|jgi:peroxiredoxin Q/BCP|nr:peroxiredoxin [Oscillatoriaceae cyanobacterium Prado104]
MLSRRQFFSTLLAICLAFLSLNFAAPAFALGGKLPALNEPAPDFSLPTNSGDGQVSLSDYRGKWLVVYFYPKDFTSGCTIEARRFQQDLPKYLAKNARIIGISADDVDSHAEFCDAEGLKFPLLADTDGKTSKAYGSWMNFISARHSFIIDPEGILRANFVKVNPTIHSREVFDRLVELQANV